MNWTTEQYVDEDGVTTERHGIRVARQRVEILRRRKKDGTILHTSWSWAGKTRPLSNKEGIPACKEAVLRLVEACLRRDLKKVQRALHLDMPVITCPECSGDGSEVGEDEEGNEAQVTCFMCDGVGKTWVNKDGCAVTISEGQRKHPYVKRLI